MKIEAFLVAAGLVLAGCAPVAIGGGAVVGSAVMQERSTLDVMNDNAIVLSINNRLLNHSGQLFRDVSVHVTEGRVVLTGTVPTRQDKVTATEIAWKTDGVTSVEDSLKVGKGEGTMAYLRDVQISNTLRLALLTDSNVSSVIYNVDTIDGVVHLTGLARSKRELERVVRHARQIAGVKKVVSHVLTIDDPRRVQTVAAAG